MVGFHGHEEILSPICSERPPSNRVGACSWAKAVVTQTQITTTISYSSEPFPKVHFVLYHVFDCRPDLLHRPADLLRRRSPPEAQSADDRPRLRPRTPAWDKPAARAADRPAPPARQNSSPAANGALVFLSATNSTPHSNPNPRTSPTASRSRKLSRAIFKADPAVPCNFRIGSLHQILRLASVATPPVPPPPTPDARCK